MFATKQRVVLPQPETTASILDYLKGLGSLESRPLAILVNAMKFKDPYTHYHVKRVASYSAILCRAMNLDRDLSRHIILASLAHDVGKLGTPDRVLKKPGRLTKDEFLVMADHPAQSVEMLEPFSDLRMLDAIVRSHHERFDGRGYPDGLSKEAIPFGARVLLVADTYDAMVSDRSYRKGCSAQVAFEELRQCSGTQFDPAVVDSFIRGMEGMSPSEMEVLELFINGLCKP